MSAATTSMNGTTSGSKTPASNSNSSAARQQLRTSASGKASESARNQAGSPVDASSKKPSAPKAWTQGNPLIQRSAAPNTANGAPNGSFKHAAAPKASPNASGNSNTADQHAHDRLLFLITNFTNGEQFTGVFSGSSLEPSDARFTMKMVRRTRSASGARANGANGVSEDYIGHGEDHLIAFDLQDIIDLNVSSVELSVSEKAQNGTAPSFRTDAEISGNLDLRERELQPWQPGADSEVGLSLEDSGATGTWDQFAANERLYNVKSDYDENMYTTSIDRSDPRYKQREAEAARIAREIERSAPVNAHVAEERKMNAEATAGLDEEDKYSGVRRESASLNKGQPNAYVPPSRRPITSQPTVAGAPFDPAIISSQLARPGATPPNRSHSQADLSQQQEKRDHAAEEAPKQAASSTDSPEKTAPTVPAVTVTAGAPNDASKSDASKVAPASSSRKPGEGATEGVERKLLDSFKQFSNNEKLRVQQHQRVLQERQRVAVRQEKSVKLNDLKKFSENFKLYSRVPDDLVPILAKTKEKQDEIVSKADSQAREKELKKTAPAAPLTTPAKPDVPAADKTPRALPTGGRPDVPNEPASPFHRQRTAQAPRAQNQAVPPPRGPAMPNSRPTPSQPQQRPGATIANVPSPIPVMPPSAPSPVRDAGVVSPSSAAFPRLNVKAMEFKPNPAASTFTPVSPSVASPVASKRPSVAAVPVPAQFVPAGKIDKPLAERTPLKDLFNPVKRMLEKSEEDKKIKDFAANGGIPQAYRTPPTWDCPEANREKTFADMFPRSLAASISPMHTPSNGGMPHQHQLPLHLQNVPPQMPSAQATPRFYPSQPHHTPNQPFDEHRMQYTSSNSSVQPSPRMGHPSMAYGGQMHPQMQHFAGGMPPYAMSPGMQMRPMPAGTQFGGPQAPPMGGHMMVQQPSNGPFMNGPMSQQMPMYSSPGPGHAQPHFANHPGQQGGPGGYASSPRGHPMSHQGSQQGHPQAQMYMVPPGGPMMMGQHPGQMGPMRNFAQPQFPGGPHPQHGGFPMNHRAMSGGGYNHQMTPRQHHAAPQPGMSPGNIPPMHNAGPGDEAK
ncbi:hypothetical protein MBLNU459_g6140t2 [Dothideomycetes sp. NU459]